PLCRTSVPPFRVAGRLVLPSLNRIQHGAETFQLEPRVMLVFLHLASRPGEVFSREDLFETVWPDSVVCEEALTRTISELRRVFRDDPKSSRVIETIRGVGYRLVAPLEACGDIHTDTGASDRPDEVPRPSDGASARILRATRSKPRSRIVGIGIAAGAALAGCVALALAVLPRPEPRGTWRVRPLTSYPGPEYSPAISPDGSMVAFSWRGEHPDAEASLDLYVLCVDDGTPVRVTTDPGPDLYPAWSPDGTSIAYAEGQGRAFRLCTVSVLGGPVRSLCTVDAAVAGLDWSPDGKTIAYAAHDDSTSGYRIHLLSLESGQSRSLAVPHEPGDSDVSPSFSPDGRTIGFVRTRSLHDEEVVLFTPESGETRRLHGGRSRVSGLDWLSDSVLLLSSADIVDYDLWKVDLRTGKRSRFDLTGRPAIEPSLAADGRRLVYGELTYDCHIWDIAIDDSGRAHPSATPLIASTRMDLNPVPSPDGRSIAFLSDRTGSTELWVADAGGGNERRLTRNLGSYLASPCWSPDGSRLAVSAMIEGTLRIVLVDAASETVTPLPASAGHAQTMAWTASGDWIYYRVQTEDGWMVCRRHPGDGPEQRVSDQGYTVLDELSDGRLLCRKDGDPALWTLDGASGRAEILVPGSIARDWFSVALAAGGLYVLRREAGESRLERFDFASATSESLGVVPLDSGFLRVSSDGSRLLYDCTTDFGLDLMVADLAEPDRAS
ncbi:MAG: PD40 domain-containing protein, partial [Candidatus Eisenbacteria bacterium]|nr:PD40 domain-containing protein [Candidatus Eisenbacteria bacterium]